MGGPQGAEVITPVPLQGWLCTSRGSLAWEVQEQWFSVHCSFLPLHLF